MTDRRDRRLDHRLDHARRLGQRIDAGWRREDIEAQLAQLHARQRARARRRIIAAPLIAATVAAAAIAVAAWREPARPPAAAMVVRSPDSERATPAPHPDGVAVLPVPPALPAPLAPPSAPAAGVLALGDGSLVTPLGSDSRLLARQVSETDVVVALAGGGARFDVPDRAARRFRAELGAVVLETRGAAFRVGITRRHIEVVAERGKLSARAGRERYVVAAGETRMFPLAAREDTAPAEPPAAAPAPDQPPAPAPLASWRDAAARGDFAAAWRALATAATPLDSMADLLLAGDVARLSGHPDAAVSQLVRAVALHPGDPRAPLAAFTLGRVHLEDLGAPRDAAQAFARARELAPAGPLAEDALAREVEAWSRAGETETARARAVIYTQRYPQGHRSHTVRRFGGLEGP